jgi:xanthosine utilization system XapX-like protein
MDEAFEAITGNSLWGLALAGIAGVAIVGRRQLRPLAKTIIKGSVSTSQWAREQMAGVTEQWQDLYAEAQHEHQSERRDQTTIATAEVSSTPRRRTASPAVEGATPT